MSEVAPLISDLAFILIVAGLVTVIFKWLKQPVILGYIVAGILAGPFGAVPSNRIRSGKHKNMGRYRRYLFVICNGTGFFIQKTDERGADSLYRRYHRCLRHDIFGLYGR